MRHALSCLIYILRKSVVFGLVEYHNRELKQTTTTTVTRTLPNKRFNGENDSRARALESLYISLPSSAKQQ